MKRILLFLAGLFYRMAEGGVRVEQVGWSRVEEPGTDKKLPLAPPHLLEAARVSA